MQGGPHYIRMSGGPCAEAPGLFVGHCLRAYMDHAGSMSTSEREHLSGYVNSANEAFEHNGFVSLLHYLSALPGGNHRLHLWTQIEGSDGMKANKLL